MTPGCDSREDNNLSSDAEVPTRPAKTLPLSRSRSVKRDIVGTHQIFVFYSLVDVRDGFARDCPHRHPVLPMLALRDRSRVAPDFLVGFRRFQRLRARRRGGESRRGQGGGRCPRDRLASQVRWSGVLREPCTTDPCQSSGPPAVDRHRDVDMLMRINADNHRPRIGRRGHAVGHGIASSGCGPSWPGWADRP